ncbi:uncharacterized protein NECHADRAFT_50192 [Fusarium vanettenii 77-13-4]|uniref:Uncharacterized protein n=1 Tax=Fusarium vanettenii (strain ATCC MYA-4622 / CBS 123669 / FGSC 9596 / NRRL 45880 / 77-13-4) TaxID=660122 RepID=C7ZP55_FUSV7|nr:uncharacterized protein NECHADRAFT_50192 [Fusarium vanettenii 77-13-4]EEU34289.1 hypothetical protein NECHADRAFT_50192 [Fusarium vanettenii 77-13-4]
MEPRRDFRFDHFHSDHELGIPEDFDDGMLDGIDWSNPESFLEAMGIKGRMPKMLSPAEVRREAKGKSRLIFAAYETLSKIIERHEATIQKRWSKKTRQQRQQILLKAWPGMPASHRPDFEALRKESKEQRERCTKYRDHYMWPNINQEDLTQPKVMPLLLNSRGRYPPPTFASADNASVHLGLASKSLVAIFHNEHVMVLNGATTAEGYGTLVAWADHPDAFEWMHTRKQFLPGEGLIILEVQARLMDFLVDFCHQILHEIPEAELISDAYPVQPEPPLKTDNDTSGFANLSAMASEAPYRLPMRLDLAKVESLLEAKKSAAEDHVWALREDPAYFAHEFLEVRDHRQEMLKDSQGRSHPATNKQREHIVWARITGTILSDAYINLEAFTELHRQAQHVRSLQDKYNTKISPEKDLPEEYMVALLRFRYFLEKEAKTPLQRLKKAVVSSPPMQKFFVHAPPTDPNSTTIIMYERPGVKKTKDEEHLIWLLQNLLQDEYTLFLIGLPHFMDELERLLQANPEVDVLVSAHVIKIIGDLSIMAQCSRQLELYQPWAQTFETKSVDHVDNLKAEHEQWKQPWTQFFPSIKDQTLTNIGRLAEPSGGKFSYPFGKRRTKDTVDALRRAEANLDAIWDKIDERLRSKAPALQRTAVHRFLSKPRTLRRTGEWVEPTAPTKDKKVADPDLDVLNRPLSNVFLDHSEDKVQGSKAQQKVKAKTKGVSSAKPAAAPEAPEPDHADPQPTFHVDAKTLKVFRTLFFNPEVNSTPGSVLWNDFLHAMVATGFRAEKLYGSVWQFSPTTLDVGRSIHFHEPHPKGKIPFEVARRHGRRLTRAYGWFGGMFVLKKK